MIRIRDIILPPGHAPEALSQEAARILGVATHRIQSLFIWRRSVDARRKPEIRMVYTVDVQISGNEEALLKRCGKSRVERAVRKTYEIPRPETEDGCRPVVIGFGPAGMFAALVLAEAGMRPVVLERGRCAGQRKERVEAFWNGGPLDPECNVQFGEGGAGTFSDGKLNTGTHDDRIRWVLEQLVEAGAPEEILYDAKPHMGTDVLFRVVQALRARILRLGGEVRFQTKLTGLEISGGAISGIQARSPEGPVFIPCRRVILAVGHSARDTFSMLLDAGISMEPKAFSMGVRIEHLQCSVDCGQYGAPADQLGLPPADYKLACHLPGGSAYTFCMCPGGYVVAAASQEGRVVTNGMSYAARAGENANSALLVSLTPEMFPEPGPLGGMHWQGQLESAAFRAGGGTYAAPAQLVGDFLARRPSTGCASVRPTYRPGVTYCDLHEVLPSAVTDVLEAALPVLGKRLRGFDQPDAVLTAPETRSSSPVRILRGRSLQSSVSGLYPCGEGAGYAGGIVSAAVDGMRCAEAVLRPRSAETQES